MKNRYSSKDTKVIESPKNNRLKITDTLPKLTDYIRRQLGEPVIQVEVTDEQIEDIVYATIEMFSEYAYQGREDVVFTLEIDDPSQMTFFLNQRVKAITNIRETSNLSSFLAVIPSYCISQSNSLTLTMLNTLDFADITNMTTALSRLSNLENIFDVSINYNWNANTKRLDILEPIHKSSYMLIEASLQYEPKEVDNIYNHPWIKKMSKARTKLLWCEVTGKYQGSLINGMTLNYDRIISEAQQEIESLTEELMNTYEEPLGIYVK